MPERGSLNLLRSALPAPAPATPLNAAPGRATLKAFEHLLEIECLLAHNRVHGERIDDRVGEFFDSVSELGVQPITPPSRLLCRGPASTHVAGRPCGKGAPDLFARVRSSICRIAIKFELI
jgi:hypothetical protein